MTVVQYGTSGNDTLAADYMVGGAGNDTYMVSESSQQIWENPNQGIDTVLSSVSYSLDIENFTLPDHLGQGPIGQPPPVITVEGTPSQIIQGSVDSLENLTLTGSDDINATGNSLNNVLTGNSGNNILNGNGGYDTLIGGAGNDTYIINNGGGVTIIEYPEQGIDTVYTSGSYSLNSNVENLVLTGNGSPDAGYGNNLSNYITGNSGQDYLDGEAGNDTLVGGAGNDTYIVDNMGDAVIEAANQGTDTVQSSISYTLGQNLENLTLIGSAYTGSGNSADNTIQGNDQNNLLIGLGGNDTLDGQQGADTMMGGIGNDSYYVDNQNDVVIEQLKSGNDTVFAEVNYTLGENVENLTLVDNYEVSPGHWVDHSNSGTGNNLNNILTDSGLGGNDTLVGMGGDDTYLVSNSNTVIIEGVNQGIDTVRINANYSLGANVENLVLMNSGYNAAGVLVGGNYYAYGNDLNNQIPVITGITR